MKSNREYVRDAGACPRCSSIDIEGGSIDVEGDSAFQKVGCNNCELEWNDVYQLIGYQVIERAEGERHTTDDPPVGPPYREV